MSIFKFIKALFFKLVNTLVAYYTLVRRKRSSRIIVKKKGVDFDTKSNRVPKSTGTKASQRSDRSNTGNK